MKYSAKKYAKALVDSILNEKTDDKKVAANFLALLQRNQDIKKAREIISLTEKLLLKKTGNKKITIETARKANTEDFLKTFAKQGDVVEEKINPALIAGLKVLVNNEKQLDLSLAKKLNNIF